MLVVVSSSYLSPSLVLRDKLVDLADKTQAHQGTLHFLELKCIGIFLSANEASPSEEG